MRDAWMAKHNIRVVRISNRDVLRNLEGLLIAIGELARTPPPPNPLPQGEGEITSANSTASSNAIPPPSSSMSDRSNLFGELRRMARTSGAVGGIAARVAGERVFGIKTDRAAHAEDLRTILGGLKGPLMKVAQFLSTVPDALPAEYAAELAQLQANAPPMGWNFVRRRMASELGADWQAKFAQFGHDAAAAASLGQVHRATPARRHRCRLQAAISGHAEHGRSRPAPVAPGDGDLSPHGQRHPA